MALFLSEYACVMPDPKEKRVTVKDEVNCGKGGTRKGTDEVKVQ